VISVLLLSRDKVCDSLAALGCAELTSPLPDHSAWNSPWGEAFFVPEVGPDRMTPAWTLEDIMEAIAAAKPSTN
jgi:hypothetical protein